MIGALIGAGTSLASGIIGAVGSAKANKRANALIDAQRRENRQWYQDKMSEDTMRRPDMQALLKKQKELLDAQYNRTAGASAVTGATDEAVAQAKASANESIADTMTNIAAQSTAYKDSIEQQYKQQDSALNQQQVAVHQNKANQIAQAASQGVSAGLNLISSDDRTLAEDKEMFKKRV